MSDQSLLVDAASAAHAVKIIKSPGATEQHICNSYRKLSKYLTVTSACPQWSVTRQAIIDADSWSPEIASSANTFLKEVFESKFLQEDKYKTELTKITRKLYDEIETYDIRALNFALYVISLIQLQPIMLKKIDIHRNMLEKLVSHQDFQGCRGADTIVQAMHSLIEQASENPDHLFVWFKITIYFMLEYNNYTLPIDTLRLITQKMNERKLPRYILESVVDELGSSGKILHCKTTGNLNIIEAWFIVGSELITKLVEDEYIFKSFLHLSKSYMMRSGTDMKIRMLTKWKQFVPIFDLSSPFDVKKTIQFSKYLLSYCTDVIIFNCDEEVKTEIIKVWWSLVKRFDYDINECYSSLVTLFFDEFESHFYRPGGFAEKLKLDYEGRMLLIDAFLQFIQYNAAEKFNRSNHLFVLSLPELGPVRSRIDAFYTEDGFIQFLNYIDFMRTSVKSLRKISLDEIFKKWYSSLDLTEINKLVAQSMRVRCALNKALTSFKTSLDAAQYMDLFAVHFSGKYCIFRGFQTDNPNNYQEYFLPLRPTLDTCQALQNSGRSSYYSSFVASVNVYITPTSMNPLRVFKMFLEIIEINFEQICCVSAKTFWKLWGFFANSIIRCMKTRKSDINTCDLSVFCTTMVLPIQAMVIMHRKKDPNVLKKWLLCHCAFHEKWIELFCVYIETACLPNQIGKSNAFLEICSRICNIILYDPDIKENTLPHISTLSYKMAEAIGFENVDFNEQCVTSLSEVEIVNEGLNNHPFIYITLQVVDSLVRNTTLPNKSSEQIEEMLKEFVKVSREKYPHVLDQIQDALSKLGKAANKKKAETDITELKPNKKLKKQN